MNFNEVLLARESCRAYADKPVTREQLLNIVEAGRLSPSACNSQPWKFMVVDEAEAKAKMCDALTLYDGKTACSWGPSVPAFIALIEQPAKVMPLVVEHYGDAQYFAPGDIGMAAMNMCYAAMAQGLSTCVLGLNEQKKMEEAFGIPEGNIVRLVLAVGYALKEGEPRKKVRKTLEEVCTFNKW